MTEHIENICKPGQGKSCCRYLVVGPDGLECIKKTEHKKTMDARVMFNSMVAQGDNCNGYSTEESLKILNEAKKN